MKCFHDDLIPDPVHVAMGDANFHTFGVCPQFFLNMFHPDLVLDKDNFIYIKTLPL